MERLEAFKVAKAANAAKKDAETDAALATAKTDLDEVCLAIKEKEAEKEAEEEEQKGDEPAEAEPLLQEEKKEEEKKE